MNVSAVVVTRGNVDLCPILESLPEEWERVVWDNGAGRCSRWLPTNPRLQDEPMFDQRVRDLAVYGRYAAIEHASGDLIFTVDDDCIVSDPRAIVDAWLVSAPLRTNHLVANMPPEFRHDGYTDSCLVGFGACFHRDAPARAFKRFFDWDGWNVIQGMTPREIIAAGTDSQGLPTFARTCDVVFTALTPRVLVDVPKVNREFAEDASRMYRQPRHVEERARMLELARQVRDG